MAHIATDTNRNNDCSESYITCRPPWKQGLWNLADSYCDANQYQYACYFYSEDGLDDYFPTVYDQSAYEEQFYGRGGM